VRLELEGAVGDRRFLLVDENGCLYNAKRHGPLVGVQARFDPGANTLELRFPDGAVVAGEVATDGAVDTTYYGSSQVADAVVGPWSDALSSFAGAAIRLVRPRDFRATDRGSDGGVSLVSTAALDVLGEHAGCDTVDGRRFRMLFGVDGIGPHAEERWLGSRVRIGEAVAQLHGNVGRCAVTTQHPDTGVADLDTLKTIKSYRDHVPTSEPLPFGVYGEVVEPGTVRLGDEIVPL
jgi:uncharacterized protein YcbX